MTLPGLLSRLGFLLLACGITWALRQISAFVKDWLRINRDLARSDIPAGPSRREALSLLKSLDTHRTILDWVEKYGSIFSTKLLHVHV
jgi:hypothetical protein